MRPIDAEALSEGIELHRKGTDQECESDRQWAVGYNAGLDRALYSIAYAKTVCLQSSEPLTLEELREMDGEPVWIRTKYDASKSFWAIVNTKGDQVESYARVELFEDYWSDWLAYRRKPEEGRP